MSRVLPILFNTDMVRAILDGRKTVTRRKIPIDVVNYCDIDTDGTLLSYENDCGDFIEPEKLCQYKQGDILYVRECGIIQSMKNFDKTVKMYFPADDTLIEFKVTPDEYERLSRFPEDKKLSPYWLTKQESRIWLKVTNVRVERLQEITPQEAWKEGAICSCMSPVQDCAGNKTAFIDIWNSTIKKSDLDRYGWDANPYVFVIEFIRIDKPEEI